MTDTARQQIDVIIKLTFEADISEDTEALNDRLSTLVISGCQTFADDICKPVEVMAIEQEAIIYDNETIRHDLLKALKKIIPLFESCIAQGNGELEGDRETIAQGRAAIAKAEGK